MLFPLVPQERKEYLGCPAPFIMGYQWDGYASDGLPIDADVVTVFLDIREVRNIEKNVFLDDISRVQFKMELHHVCETVHTRVLTVSSYFNNTHSYQTLI